MTAATGNERLQALLPPREIVLKPEAGNLVLITLADFRPAPFLMQSPPGICTPNVGNTVS